MITTILGLSCLAGAGIAGYCWVQDENQETLYYENKNKDIIKIKAVKSILVSAAVIGCVYMITKKF